MEAEHLLSELNEMMGISEKPKTVKVKASAKGSKAGGSSKKSEVETP